MLVENSYPHDKRVRNEAEALTSAGYSVAVICLRKDGQARSEMVEGVHVYRLPRFELFQKTPRENPTLLQKIALKARSLLGYVSEYVYFTTACLMLSVYVALKDGFDVIHAHNPPDTLFAVAFPWKLLGKKYVFDHHDLCPELYRSRYGVEHDFTARVLSWIELANLKLANVTIATNDSYKQIHIERGGRRAETVFVVRNGPNRDRMQMPSPCQRLRGLNKKILVYIGSLNPQDGVDYLLRSLKHLVYDLKREGFHCVILGSGDSLGDLRKLGTELRLNDYVEFPGFVPEDQLQRTLAAADICVDPDPSSPLNDLSTWIKIMEYMAYGKPIVSFSLKETVFSAGDSALFVRPNDEMAFAEATARLMDDDVLRQQMGCYGRMRVERDLQWSVVSKNLLDAYASLSLRKQDAK